jgi:hypothetical protein
MRRLHWTAFAVFISFALPVYSVPPYFWFSTYSIEDYVATGGCWSNLIYCHEDADAFVQCVADYAIQNSKYQYNRRDAEVTAAKWTGTYSEVNQADFVFYSGHGWGKGPFLGCGTGYPLTNYTDIKFGASAYLKWVAAAACMFYAPDEFDDANTGMTPLQRWDNSFRGVHSVLGHRASSWDHTCSFEMCDHFFFRWVHNGVSIYWAWRDSQIEYGYHVPKAKGDCFVGTGLSPATGAVNSQYAYESWIDAGDEKAPDGIGWLGYTEVDVPEY